MFSLIVNQIIQSYGHISHPNLSNILENSIIFLCNFKYIVYSKLVLTPVPHCRNIHTLIESKLLYNTIKNVNLNKLLKKKIRTFHLFFIFLI